MTVRVTLLSPAMSAALREARFDDGAPLDDAGVRQARAAAGGLPRISAALCAPSPRCRGTATALGLSPASVPELRDLEVGDWRGRGLAELSAAEPEAVAAWLADPGAAPHGGESLLDLVARVGSWLDGRTDDGRLLAVVEPAVVRAAVVHALELPPRLFWRLDVPPLTLTELTGRAGRWNLRCGRPAAPEPAPPVS
ncbi:histidine phosphatase family protein [Streptomyces syringium]|uniref:histidine phosphatase family protein n=1 Tax=Streptomyces syringium TaxID=76729 RepID=UPI0034225B4C